MAFSHFRSHTREYDVSYARLNIRVVGIDRTPSAFFFQPALVPDDFGNFWDFSADECGFFHGQLLKSIVGG